MWHPGTTTCLKLAQSLDQLFSKNFQPPWEAALPDCDTQQQRDWFAQKRREIDLIEQEMGKKFRGLSGKPARARES